MIRVHPAPAPAPSVAQAAVWVGLAEALAGAR